MHLLVVTHPVSETTSLVIQHASELGRVFRVVLIEAEFIEPFVMDRVDLP